MNCKIANELPIVSFLKTLGIEPVKISGKFIWYLSPFRNERHASFRVDLERNRFKDFGDDSAGTLIDLAMILWSCSIREVLIKLSEREIPSRKDLVSFSFQERAGCFQIANVKILENDTLLNYLWSRGITKNLANEYCFELHYQINSKSYFTVGFKNESGGWEHRNKFFKGCLGRKDVTLFKKNSTVCVFEGFVDFLSALVLWPEINSKSVLVLNSVTQTENAISKLSQIQPESIECYLDGDEAGRNATQKIVKAFVNAKDISSRFTQYKCKDVNELLMLSDQIQQNYGK